MPAGRPKGIPQTAEMKQKVSDANRGKTLSPEHVEGIRAGNKAYQAKVHRLLKIAEEFDIALE